MGSQVSALLHAFNSTFRSYSALKERTSVSPGIPVQNSSLPYWTVPNSSIAQFGADKQLPSETEIVIIGSGISGTAIAKTILQGSSVDVVMLEARDICSGATGRNGGHICPVVYNEYALLKANHGAAAALEILRFRLAHIRTLLDIAEESNLLDVSQARNVDDYDVYMHPDLLRKAKADLEVFLKEAPGDLHEGFRLLDEDNLEVKSLPMEHIQVLHINPSSLQKLQLSSSVRGCIAKPGASIHSYRLVTGLLYNLLSQYPNFHIYTRTPCTDIQTSEECYVVSTPRGQIKASHVIHATNAWSSHLLPGLRKKIVPFRAHMSAQRPGQNLATSSSSRAFVFYPTEHPYTYDYLTQLLPRDPDPNKLPTDGEMMYGGGQNLGGVSTEVFLDNIGVADDGDTQFQIEAYLSGSLERYFVENWGAEGVEKVDEADVEAKWGKGRVKSVWSGIIGLSADMLPWVGRIPKIASGRNQPAPKRSSLSAAAQLTPPGEWISAGFTGEGMVHAWLCGRAVARMVLGLAEGPATSPCSSSPTLRSTSQTVSVNADDVPLPKAFLITNQRVRKANLEHLIDLYT